MVANDSASLVILTKPIACASPAALPCLFAASRLHARDASLDRLQFQLCTANETSSLAHIIRINDGELG